MQTSNCDNYGRRIGIDRRQVIYTVHVPERRSGKDRRVLSDRRKNIRSEYSNNPESGN